MGDCPGCGKRINPNRLACAHCWNDLPVSLRMAVVTSWRTAAGSAERVRAATAALDWYSNNPRSVHV